MPQYTVFEVDLSSADSLVISQFSGLFRFVDAVDSSGSQVLTAKINIKVGVVDNPTLPLRIANGVRSVVASELTVSWDAQSGVTATLLVSPSPAEMDVDTEPPAQLVTGNLAPTFTHDAVTIGTSEGVIVAANTARRKVTIRNEGAETIYLGNTGLSTSDGLPLDSGQAFTLDGTTAAIYGISGTAGQDVRYLEEG